MRADVLEVALPKVLQCSCVSIYSSTCPDKKKGRKKWKNKKGGKNLAKYCGQ